MKIVVLGTFDQQLEAFFARCGDRPEEAVQE
jgi:hypothetical protein